MADSITTPATKSQVSVLYKFFGPKANNDGSMQTLAQFKGEADKLTAEDKQKLATMAAKALGYTQEQCAFEFV